MVVDGKLYTHLALHVAGEHNLSNALAAASAAYVLGWAAMKMWVVMAVVVVLPWVPAMQMAFS